MIRVLRHLVGYDFHKAVKIATASVLAAVICIGVSEVTSVRAATDATASGDVVKVRLGGDKAQTRIVLELNRAAKGKLLSADTASSAVLDLSDVRMDGPLSGEGRGLVSGWRVENQGGAVRLKLSYQGQAKIARRFILPPADGVGVYRYVIDVVPAAVTPPGDEATRLLIPDTTKASAATQLKAEVPLRRSLKKIVVIDAGHGGKDSGALGTFSYEKDVNLAAAKALKTKLESTGRYKVIMTRETDGFVDLSARVRIARSADADLFISLHSDSGPDKSTRGASIYTLSDSGTERAARKALVRGDWSLAERPADQMVNRILIDLTQRATKNRSATFAQVLLNNIGDTTPLLKTSHRQAGFVVLLAPDVPAVLLEMGFITNALDEKLLNDSAQRNRMMTSVAKSIDQYFENDVRYASFVMMPKAMR
ncbi:N-acetylmuramoyl-L-alanine amidase family protein [Asticcacaulis endophyticus]|uniref:N-acetylmuramoyl-L-alanine amidase n=1 Tax=Asticcacaulis endophyticus TaxID=1395890 RepID=A0A918UX79_9CAUL|nr:N-acetylmuramoyl-L-alanine amidase [Asticcacaulis endophyticus]GGZ40231.1 N-acetylmuramoyl-L-alanine amidase [Asticcacaulis endophyticus]